MSRCFSSYYHLEITLLDRSSPNLSRRILRGSPSIRSAGRTPYPTATGLPGKLDFEIANCPSFIPVSSADFWQDLSLAPTTRLGDRWDQLPSVEPTSPAVFWYEPDSIIAPSRPENSSTPFTPAPTLDYRFGPISVDWIDYPAAHPAFAFGPRSRDNLSDFEGASASSSHPDENYPHSSASGMRHLHSTTAPAPPHPAHKSLTQTHVSLPTARFVPHNAHDYSKGKYQLGSTDLGYGTIHLYRDLEEAASTQPPELDGHPSWIKKNTRVKTQKQRQRPESLETMSEEDNEGMVIGVLAIPSYMTAQDFLAFISPFVESIQSVRMLRDALPNRCMGLIKFRTKAFADRFAHEFNGRPFSHLQDREICHTAKIRSIKFKSSLIPPFTFPALLPPALITPTAHELPTCPVCLERMDASVSGLMTSTCSHTFHCHCLSNWGDSRCPICRYSQMRLAAPSATPSNRETSECAACGSIANLWICLICGHVGCGRYQGGHAYRHFEESAHLYALELGSQRVWDYVGDNYVHRLIQTKSDQIVELPALSSAVFDSGGGGPSPNEAVQQSKIEAISEEFGHLVASQLDSQRAFYEQEIEMLRRERFQEPDLSQSIAKVSQAQLLIETHGKRVKELEEKLSKVEQERDDIALEFQNDKKRFERKVEKTLESNRKFEKELQEEKALGIGIRAKLLKMESEREDGERRTKALEEQVVDLKEQLRDIMFFLDAQTKIEREGAEELRGGTLLVPAQENTLPPPSNNKSGRRKKR